MCVALALVIGANSSLSVALPDLAADLGATQTQLSYVVNIYALVFAALLLPIGIAADKFGRRGFLVAGLVVFGAASLASAYVDTAAAVIVLRGLAGLGAAAVMPATLSVLVDAFPPERRTFAVSVWAGVSGAGAMLGVLLAGVMLELFWWGSVQVAYGVAAVAVRRRRAGRRPAQPQPGSVAGRCRQRAGPGRPVRPRARHASRSRAGLDIALDL
jgi:MFS family permease